MWLTEADFVVVSMKSDASGDDGYGYHVGDFEYCRMWTPAELGHNIQWKELYPVLQACHKFKSEWTGKIVRAGVDNMGVVFMINSGSSRDTDCMVLLRELSELQRIYGFDLVASWVPHFFYLRSDALTHMQVGWSMGAPAAAKGH
jgi:hypothetical protein